MNDIFLSYASEDRDVARKLVDVFRDGGFSVYWDRETPVGKSWDRVVEEQLQHAGVVTSLWSPRSVDSEWVMIEATEAMERKKLFPALIAATPIPLRFKLTQYADLSDWDGSGTHDGCARLLSAIATHLGRSFPAPPPSLQREISARIERRPETHDVFLAYASDDRDIAKALVSVLHAAHISVWWDRTILPGETWRNTIQRALERSRAVMVLWSHESVNSDWVKEEAEWGRRHKILVPARIEDVPLPIGFRAIQTVDLSQWDQKTMTTPIQTLVEDLISLGVSVIHDPGSVTRSRKPESPTPSTRESDRRRMENLGTNKADQVEAVAVNVPIRKSPTLREALERHWLAVVVIVIATLWLMSFLY
jgi:TIR domain